MFSSTKLQLPATKLELQDILEKVSTPYSVEVLYSLHKFIPETADLNELNHFAELILAMDEIDPGKILAFEALVKMDERNKVPYSMNRLIDLAQNTDSVLVVPVGNDRELGQFVIDNDMDERLYKVDNTILTLIDAEKVGREYRETEGGIYLHGRYMVPIGDIIENPKHCQSDQMGIKI